MAEQNNLDNVQIEAIKLSCNDLTIENIINATYMDYVVIDGIVYDVICNQYGLDEDLVNRCEVQCNGDYMIISLEDYKLEEDLFKGIAEAITDSMVQEFEEGEQL